MATIWEESRTQGAKMKGRPLKEKLEYFWEYYKIPVLIAAGAAALIIALARAWINSRDFALSIVAVNSIADTVGATGEWTNDLSALVEFDPKEYEVYIDATLSLGSANATANAEYASSQKLAALLSASSIDILIADTPVFEQYAQNGVFTDLRDIYSEEELESYGDSIYYTDAATFADYEETDFDVTVKQAEYNIDHSNPLTMTDPIPVGFIAGEHSRLIDSDAYANLNNTDTYQGYPVEVIVGIPSNTPRYPAALIGVDYLLGNPNAK